MRAYRTPGMEAGRVKGEGRGRAHPLEKRGYGWDYRVWALTVLLNIMHTHCGKIYTLLRSMSISKQFKCRIHIYTRA